MRLDARNGPPDINWQVFHVPSARRLRYVVWIDGETKQWAEYALDARGATLRGLWRGTGADGAHGPTAHRLLPGPEAGADRHGGGRR